MVLLVCWIFPSVNRLSQIFNEQPRPFLICNVSIYLIDHIVENTFHAVNTVLHSLTANLTGNVYHVLPLSNFLPNLVGALNAIVYGLSESVFIEFYKPKLVRYY